MSETGWWAPIALLVTLALAAATVSALPEPDPEQPALLGDAPSVPGHPGGTGWAKEAARQGLDDVRVRLENAGAGGVVDVGPDVPAPGHPPGGQSGGSHQGEPSQPTQPSQPSQPSQGQPGQPAAPRPATPSLQAPAIPGLAGRLAALAHEVVAAAEALVPQAVRTAQEAADKATALPQELLAPEASADEAEATPQGTAATPPGASMIGPTLLIAAGAAATATFVGFWLAGSSGAVGAQAASRAGDLRRLLPFASPLFTRFEKDTVLGHPRREALYALILQEPGISLQALGDASGLSRTAVIHHLRLMEQQHLIVSRRVGRSRHYFENGGRYGHDQKEAYALLQNPRSREVADYIRANPGAMQKALCQALGIQPSIAHWHVRRLEEARVVETLRKGRTVAYFPGPGLQGMDATVPAVGQASATA